MEKFKKILLPFIIVGMMTGCSGKNNANSDKKNTNTNSSPTMTEQSTDKITDDSSETIQTEDFTTPALYINTLSKEPDVLEFVTEPVSLHVSSDIKSWTPDYVIPPEPYYEECTISLKDSSENTVLDSVTGKVKVRGNWTTTYDKKGLRIKFDKKQSMMGINDGAQAKNWVLIAEYKDASMLRNKTTLSIAREILEEDGLYASDAELVEVYINDNYWGVYLLAEMQQINENRVNITEAQKDYTGTDIGYLMEFDGYFVNEEELQQFHVDYADNAPLVPYDGSYSPEKTVTCLNESSLDYKKDVGITIVSDIYSQQQHDFIANFVKGTYKIMYEAAYNDKAYEFSDDYTKLKESSLTPREAVEKVVDVESLADIYIINELACDADIYWSSFFMSADFGAEGNKKLTFTAPWDFDSAMGNKDRCANGQGFYAANVVPDVNGGAYYTINPWLAVLAHEDWYFDIVKEKWTDSYNAGVFERAIQMIYEDSEKNADAFERNYDKWNNIINNDDFKDELSREAAACKTQSEAAEYLAQWLEKRVTFLNENFNT